MTMISKTKAMMARKKNGQTVLHHEISGRGAAPSGTVFMARQILRRGGDLQRAIEMVEGAITESLDAPDMTLGYFLLADLYNRIGDAVLAQEWARRGQQLRQQIDGG